MSDTRPRIALVLPALDEEQALPLVLADVERLQRSAEAPLFDPILVVDNGSRDRTPEIARRAAVTLLQEPRRGYGAACLRALAHLRNRPPDIVVFMDADHSDHVEDVPALVRAIVAEGYDLALGSRTQGAPESGALRPQARFGNWLATGLIRMWCGHRYSDLGPLRAVRWPILERMRLADRDFGWTVEMQVRALQIGARVTEVPVRYRRRVGRSKISGTVWGSVRAGVKILVTLWKLTRSRASFGLAAAVFTAAPGVGPARAAVPAPTAVTAPADSARFDHTLWDRLVSTYVDSTGRVAYRDLKRRDGATLDSYLHSLTTARPDLWPEPEQLAFWINAYNAGIVGAILQGFSAESLIGRGRIFKFWKFEVAGSSRSLDEIEHEILRRRFHEPRFHFAIACAAASCPRLRREAYVGDRLETQLEDQAHGFLNDHRRNRYDVAQGEVRLSRIFEWFREDFEHDGPLLPAVAGYVDDTRVRDWLRNDAHIQVGFLDYDWSLNAQPDQRPERRRHAPGN